MSPINITNILLRLAEYNKNLNANNNLHRLHRQNTTQNKGLNTNQNLPNLNPNPTLNQPGNIINKPSNMPNTPQLQNPTLSQTGSENANKIIQNNLENNVNNILKQQAINNFVKTNDVNTANNTAKSFFSIHHSSNNNLNIKAQNINNLKEMMNLPKEMNDVINLIQNQGQKQVKATNQQSSGLILLNNINIKNLTQIIQNGSKEALQQLVNTNVKQNLSKAELNQLEEAISYLNTSASSQESQTQALKNFMLLYLPWLPLEEGMDFELDFSFSEGSEESDENILNITIMTKHFGEIHILIILKSICSFEIYIQCCSKFPKNILLKLVKGEEKKHSLQTNFVFEEQKNFEPKALSKEAKITLSNVNEISPFLLLIANSIIKNTFLLDAQASE